MRLGVPRETVAGRAPRRPRSGHRRSPGRERQRGARRGRSRLGRGLHRRRRMRKQAPRSSSRPRTSTRSAGLVCKVQRPSADELAALREGTVLVALLQPLVDQELPRRLAARGRHGVLDGRDPAHHPRAADGRALFPEHRRRLQGGRRCRRDARQVLAHAHDRGRQRSRRRRCSSSAPASPGSRRSRPPAGSARSSRLSTSARS